MKRNGYPMTEELARELDAHFAEREARRILQPLWWRALKFVGLAIWSIGA